VSLKIIPKKLLNIIIIIIAAIMIGTAGFTFIGGSERSVLDALYMTAITLTTVGCGDVIGLDNKLLGKLFTIIYVFIGAGTIAYLFTTLAAYIVEGELRKVFRRRPSRPRGKGTPGGARVRRFGQRAARSTPCCSLKIDNALQRMIVFHERKR